ncbi:MAG: ABC transporter substrate-binding protein [Promethearchaeota archaeon]
MLTDRKKRILALTFGAAFLFMAISPIFSQGIAIPADLSIGPYVDKVVYKVIDNEDQRILALQSGEIEMDNSFFNPVHLPALDADPEISIFSALRNGYGHITINCGKYPLNISAFRRAFAYAFDKTRVTTEVMSGFNQEQDSLVPYPNSFCIEDEMPYHYYTAQVQIGNQILNDSHFDIDPVTGWRNAPDGTPFNVVIEYGASVAVVGGGTAQIGVDALHALHVNAETKASDFNEYISRLDSHGDYDMVFFAYNYLTNDVSWLAYRYWSEYADTPYQNPSNFRNATYDTYRNALLYGTTYEEVYEAAKQMQLILQYNVPLLVVYENTYMQAYRNDKFEGHVGDLTRYISGPWTFRHIKPIGATHGGTVSIAIGEEPDSFNIFTTNSAYSAAILDELWPSLYARAPDVSPYPDIAESLVTETHSTNSLVPDGHTRFTIDIIQNATWSDGVPLTADDVAFTFTYAFESYAYGNPAGVGLTDLVSAYAPTPYQVVIEFSTESYWHFSNFAYTTIIPEHIFNDVDGVGYAGWNTWNPVFDPAQPNVNCGPFTFTDYDAGNFYEISANPSFYHYPVFPPETTTTTTTAPPPDMTLAIVAGAVGAAVVILIGGFVLLRQK